MTILTILLQNHAKEVTNINFSSLIIKVGNLCINLGPLNMNQTSGEVQCGVCGVIRFYKSIAKTKKYGAYSCDSCRKFIAKSIENQNSINRCNNDRGKLVIYLFLMNIFFY